MDEVAALGALAEATGLRLDTLVMLWMVVEIRKVRGALNGLRPQLPAPPSATPTLTEVADG